MSNQLVSLLIATATLIVVVAAWLVALAANRKFLAGRSPVAALAVAVILTFVFLRFGLTLSGVVTLPWVGTFAVALLAGVVSVQEQPSSAAGLCTGLSAMTGALAVFAAASEQVLPAAAAAAACGFLLGAAARAKSG